MSAVLERREVGDAPPVPEKSGVRLSSRPSIEVQREQLANLLGGRFIKMHHLSAQTHDDFDLFEYDIRNGQFLPIFPTAMQVGASFDWDLDEVKSYQKPALVLPPPHRVSADLLEAFDQRYPYDLKDSSLAALHPDLFTNPILTNRESFYKRRSPNWIPQAFSASIVEGATRVKLHDWDQLALPLDQRLALKNKHCPDEAGMTSSHYAMLAMQATVRGKPIDEGAFTLLDGEVLSGDRVLTSDRFPIAHCDRGRPVIDWVASDFARSNRVRFRRVLAANNPIELDAA